MLVVYSLFIRALLNCLPALLHYIAVVVLYMAQQCRVGAQPFHVSGPNCTLHFGITHCDHNIGMEWWSLDYVYQGKTLPVSML